MKNLKLFIPIFLLLSFAPINAFAASGSATISQPAVVSSGGETHATITGSIDATAAGNLSAGFDLFVVYQDDNSGGTVDLSNLSNAKTVLVTVTGQKQYGGVDPTKALPNGEYALSVTLNNLVPSRYVYQLLIGNPQLNRGKYSWDFATARYLLTPQYYFDVTLPSLTQNYKLVGPVNTGGDASSGFWADPEVIITEPLPGDYQLEMGYAQAAGVGDVHYSCVLGGEFVGSSVKVTGSEPVHIKNSGTFTKLAPGLYCVGLRYKASGKAVQQVAVNPPSGTYFIFTNAGTSGIVPIGGVKPPVGATLDASANGNGCSSNADNTTYCLLAPLPGVGDGSGNLDVAKGLGDYINTIIRLVMGLIGVLSVLMIIVGGLEYMTTVNLGEKEGAKTRITNALLGLLIALASYLILNTINPNLVNLSVVVQRVSLATDETDETDGGIPAGLPPVTGITVPPTADAQTEAKTVLANSSIILLGKFGSEDDRSSAKQNVTDTANGQSAWTTVGARQVSLDARIFTGMLTMASLYPIQVNFILGGTHSTSSLHYTGKAFDVQANPSDTAKNTKLMDACRAAGATEIIGPCSNNLSAKICAATKYKTNGDHQTHIHCGWR